MMIRITLICVYKYDINCSNVIHSKKMIKKLINNLKKEYNANFKIELNPTDAFLC